MGRIEWWLTRALTVLLGQRCPKCGSRRGVGTWTSGYCWKMRLFHDRKAWQLCLNCAHEWEFSPWWIRPFRKWWWADCNIFGRGVIDSLRGGGLSSVWRGGPISLQHWCLERREWRWFWQSRVSPGWSLPWVCFSRNAQNKCYESGLSRWICVYRDVTERYCRATA